jgi:hypothetical protein
MAGRTSNYDSRMPDWTSRQISMPIQSRVKMEDGYGDEFKREVDKCLSTYIMIADDFSISVPFLIPMIGRSTAFLPFVPSLI